MKSITSSANPHFRALRKLVQSSQERRKTGLSVLDGVHLVAAYGEHVGLPRSVAVSRAGLANPEVRGLVESLKGVEILALGDSLFATLSSVATPTGILAVVKTPRPVTAPPGMDACVMLEDLQDPGNLGSILRTCAAAGVRHVLLSKGSVHAWSPRVLRAGMGAHFVLSIHEGADLVAMHRNLYWRTDEGWRLDGGAYVAGLEEAIGRRAEVCGKPSEAYFSSALEQIGVPPARAAMVGDDVASDVLGAQAVGLTGVLVRTGKFRPEDLERVSGAPDVILDSIRDLPRMLAAS